jgi:hypothetical protein
MFTLRKREYGSVHTIARLDQFLVKFTFDRHPFVEFPDRF